MARPKTIISKAELAAILKLSRGRITQLAAKGLPVRGDGRVSLPEAVSWYNDNVRKDMAKRGPKSIRVMPAAEAPAASVDLDEFGRIAFEQGRAKIAHHLCGAVRGSLLPIVAEMDLPGVTSDEGGFRLRVGLAALVDYLMVQWCAELLAMGRERKFIGELPAIDFKKLFNPAGKDAKAWFKALQAFWQSEPNGPEERMWPPDFTRDWLPEEPIPAPPKAA